MCLGAIYWARPKAVYFAAGHKDAATSGFDDSFIYEEINKEYESRNIPFYQLTLQKPLLHLKHGTHTTKRKNTKKTPAPQQVSVDA